MERLAQDEVKFVQFQTGLRGKYKDNNSFVGPVRMAPLSTGSYTLTEAGDLKHFVQELASALAFITQHVSEKKNSHL